MKDELKGINFDKYMPLEAAKFYAEFNDANDFTKKVQALQNQIKSPVKSPKDLNKTCSNKLMLL